MIEQFDGSFLIRAFLIERECVYYTVTLSFSILTTIISDADAEVSSCSERHNSVLLMSLRWQPYSRLRTKGSDSDSDSRLTSIRVSNVWPETLLDNRTWWVTWKKRKEIFYSHVGRIHRTQLPGRLFSPSDICKNCPTTFYCIFQLVRVPMSTMQSIGLCFLSS